MERLAVFMLLEDGDGKNDYKAITLREDATGLEWTIYRENTVFLQERGYAQNTQWAGSNKFRYPRGFFPAGTYTVTASDLSNHTVTASITLQEPEPVTESPFQFKLEDSRWRIVQSGVLMCSSFSLIMLSADLQPLTVQQLYPDSSGSYSGTLDSLQNLPSDTRYIQCFGENADQSAAFLTDPLPIPNERHTD